MKWFYNMKISAKILVGFFVVAFIAVIIGVQGILNVNKISKLDTQLYEKMTKPLEDVIKISNSFSSIRVNVREILLEDDLSKVQEISNTIKETSNEFDLSANKILRQHLLLKVQKL